MQKITRPSLQASYKDALVFDNPLTDSISTNQFSASYDERPGWAIGPFDRDTKLTFRQKSDWADPTSIGWTNSSIFNPSLIEHQGKLILLYRASPRKESTASRIGLATYDAADGWVDGALNPIIYPTQDNELLGCEDPKIYRAEGRYFLFYNGIWSVSGTEEEALYPSPHSKFRPIGCDINLAVSDDLVEWTKLGPVVPYKDSRLWAKGAVIPRDPLGNAVKIDGQYLMYLSEGCNGRPMVGRSQDMINWAFDVQPYLDLSPLGGSLHEVACATTHHNQFELVMDFFYSTEDGGFAAAQARYDIREPFRQREINRGGSLAWGGLLKYQGQWIFAQGWDAPRDSREMYFYRAPFNFQSPAGSDKNHEEANR